MFPPVSYTSWPTVSVGSVRLPVLVVLLVRSACSVSVICRAIVTSDSSDGSVTSDASSVFQSSIVSVKSAVKSEYSSTL